MFTIIQDLTSVDLNYQGKTKVREKILSNFIVRHKNDSGPDLEAEFADAGSLFLTRITTWLRLTLVVSARCQFVCLLRQSVSWLAYKTTPRYGGTLLVLY